jgi:hypothetical protein
MTMAGRKLAALALATSSVVGTVLMRRRRRLNQTRVDLYFDDGSMVSLADDAPAAAGIVPAANAIIHAG